VSGVNLEAHAFAVGVFAHEPSMNFFGHAALAASHFAALSPPLPSAELALLCAGSMLPDFVGMLRMGRPVVLDERVARGVSFHHRTDHVFHDLESFKQLSRDAFAWLSAQQVPRGPARAVAHIGVEMLLDEVLSDDDSACDAYRAALRTPLEGTLSFVAPSDSERLATLRAMLLERAATRLEPSPQQVAERIRRSLAGRPRLATDAAAQPRLSSWVERTRPLVVSAAPELLATLRAQLANQERPE
jgi:hypothetical protein